MKPFLYITALTTLLTAAPQISVDNAVFDFGTVKETDTTYNHTFVITNTGDELLKISKVKPGCSCTIVKFDDKLKPGESSKIVAALDISGKHGKQNKPITIISNAEDDPILRLSMTGFIMGPINMDRRYGMFRVETGSDLIKDSIGLISTKKDLEIISAHYRQRGIEDTVTIPVEVELTPKEIDKKNDAQSYKMSFSFVSDAQMSQAGTIWFKTNHEEKPTLEFRCMVELPREEDTAK